MQKCGRARRGSFGGRRCRLGDWAVRCPPALIVTVLASGATVVVLGSAILHALSAGLSSTVVVLRIPVVRIGSLSREFGGGHLLGADASVHSGTVSTTPLLLLLQELHAIPASRVGIHIAVRSPDAESKLGTGRDDHDIPPGHNGKIAKDVISPGGRPRPLDPRVVSAIVRARVQVDEDPAQAGLVGVEMAVVVPVVPDVSGDCSPDDGRCCRRRHHQRFRGVDARDADDIM
mmetsp:Transcript_15609/g.37492  ORF Transcript_15609/g.37492 Transcript_15609/m.37492 type:complete len:232 (-) Transcript_15609:539-1234(-)